MRLRAIWMLGLSLVLAGLAVLAAQQWVQRPTTVITANERTTTVVVASVRLNVGSPIGKERLREVAWPSNAVPSGSFRSIQDIVSGDQQRVALQRIEIDEPILPSKVSGFGGRATLSTVIDQSMRAATIRVNDVIGVAGFVLPGDWVDVMLTRSPEAGGVRGAEVATDILLQRVKVLAIDQEFDNRKDTPAVAKAVTLEVTPGDAQKLMLAQQVGALSLSLRNVANDVTVDPRTVRLSDLRVGEAEIKPAEGPKPVEVKTEPAPTPAPKPKPTVTVVRGVESYDYEVTIERGSRAPNAPVSRIGAPTLRGPAAKPEPAPLNRRQQIERGASADPGAVNTAKEVADEAIRR